MTDDRSLERAARSWIEVGPTRAPEPAVQAALLRIQTTSQERDLDPVEVPSHDHACSSGGLRGRRRARAGRPRPRRRVDRQTERHAITIRGGRRTVDVSVRRTGSCDAELEGLLVAPGSDPGRAPRQRDRSVRVPDRGVQPGPTSLLLPGSGRYDRPDRRRVPAQPAVWRQCPRRTSRPTGNGSCSRTGPSCRGCTRQIWTGTASAISRWTARAACSIPTMTRPPSASCTCGWRATRAGSRSWSSPPARPRGSSRPSGRRPTRCRSSRPGRPTAGPSPSAGSRGAVASPSSGPCTTATSRRSRASYRCWTSRAASSPTWISRTRSRRCELVTRQRDHRLHGHAGVDHGELRVRAG